MERTDYDESKRALHARQRKPTHTEAKNTTMLYYLTLLALASTAVAFTPGSKPAPKSNRAGTGPSSNICGYEYPALPEPASAPGRPIWFEVDADVPPANPDLSCYYTGDRWLCAYDADLKLAVDAEDSY